VADPFTEAAAIVARLQSKPETMSYYHAVAALIDLGLKPNVAENFVRARSCDTVTAAEVAEVIRERLTKAQKDVDEATGQRDGLAEILRLWEARS
jgi:hypothetical protein